MAQIFDMGTMWQLSIFPDIQTVEVIDEINEKGYKATLGFDPSSDRHVVSEVLYLKSMYSINDVMKKLQELHDCDKCTALDKTKLAFDGIQIPSPDIGLKQLSTQSAPVYANPSEVVRTYPPPPPVPLSQQVKPNVKDIFAQVVMDAYLTPPGMYFLGMMLDDHALMESAYPAEKKDTGQFMGDMIDFMSGDVDFMRSPEEAKEFLSVMRTDEELKQAGVNGVKVKKPVTPFNNIVIY